MDINLDYVILITDESLDMEEVYTRATKSFREKFMMYLIGKLF